MLSKKPNAEGIKLKARAAGVLPFRLNGSKGFSYQIPQKQTISFIHLTFTAYQYALF